MRWGTWGYLVSAALVLSGCSVMGDEAISKYSNCDEVRSDFPSGVAGENSARVDLSVRPITDSDGYRKAADLDTDSDGIACEFENPPKAEKQASPEKPVNNSNFYFFRVSNGSLERKGNLGDWHTFDFETDGLSEIRTAAYENMRLISTEVPAQVSWKVGDGVPSDMRDAYKYQVEQTLLRLPFASGDLPIDLVLYSENDYALAQEYWSQFFHAEETLARRRNDLAAYSEPGGVEWSVGGSSDVRQPLDFSTPIVGVDFYMSSQHTQDEHLLPDHVPHELFHAWQWQAVGLPEKIAARERFDIAEYIPCHAMEGAATTIGTALLMPHVGWYSDNADVIVRRIANQSGITALSASEARALLQKGESWESCSEAYAIGMLAHEWLIGKFGFESFLEIYRLAGQRVPYSESIQTLYGMSLEEFYVEVSEYISQEFNRALQKNY